MLIVRHTTERVIPTHALPAGQTFDEEYYYRRLQHYLRPAMRHKRRRLLQNNVPIVLYDNARCHVTSNVTRLLRRWQ
ncbi:hypothetical protein TNCV_1172511 [Trichonephila clavipes]|uniref:Transposase n=1 Tax=Trichonephila clavipes TaxID=2585209 RepID=A0A8X6V3H2_TRICX|nr:hypothetical protein TNCV_1172511 [Trichonephila clavipes]